MKKVTQSGFDVHFEAIIKKDPKLAKEYSNQFAQLPLPTQLAIMRRRQWLSQKALAKKLKTKQPHIARMERSGYDPKLSSVMNQARALHCHLLAVPDDILSKVAQLMAARR